MNHDIKKSFRSFDLCIYNMKFSVVSAAFFALLIALTSAQQLSVSYDAFYDSPDESLATVACSDGSNGLITRGYTTFGSLKDFPNIGGAPEVTGFNSPACGSCWRLTYNNDHTGETAINILAIDVSRPDFNIGIEALNTLTGGQAIQLGRVPITATQVNASDCQI